MTTEEAIEILYKMDSMTWRSGERGLEAVEMAANALRKKPASEDLEQAKNDAWFNYEYRDTSGRLYRSCFEDGFELGAQWQKEREFTHIESTDNGYQAAIHYMEDCQEVDDFVRRGIDEIAERYFCKGYEQATKDLMKDAIEVKINRDTLYDLKPFIHEKYLDYKIGDKVKVIIIKE